VVNETDSATLIPRLRALAAQGPADAVQLASTVANKATEKYHVFLTAELLSMDYASSRLDTERA
jgi:ATP-dependent helicase Lhr and Lhr-like helicase